MRNLYSNHFLSSLMEDVPFNQHKGNNSYKKQNFEMSKWSIDITKSSGLHNPATYFY